MTLPIKKKSAIKSERLTLKPYSAADTAALVDLLSNSEIAKTFMIPEFESVAQAEALAKKLIAFSQTEDTDHLEFGIYLRDELIGFVNDCGINGDEIEIGYVIHPEHQGHGFATEALKTIIRELREMGFCKVTAGFFEENQASLRVMQKCGMSLTDHTDDIDYRGTHHVCRYCEINF